MYIMIKSAFDQYVAFLLELVVTVDAEAVA